MKKVIDRDRGWNVDPTLWWRPLIITRLYKTLFLLKQSGVLWKEIVFKSECYCCAAGSDRWHLELRMTRRREFEWSDRPRTREDPTPTRASSMADASPTSDTWLWLSRECCARVAGAASSFAADDGPGNASCCAWGNYPSPRTAARSRRMEWLAWRRWAPIWDSWTATKSNSSRRPSNPFGWWGSWGASQWPSERRRSTSGRSTILTHLKFDQ